MSSWFKLFVFVFGAGALVSCRSPMLVKERVQIDLVGESLLLMSGQDQSRYYILYVPATCDLSTPVPVVLMFHGGGGTPEGLARTSQMNKQADLHGFVVVYPSGSGSNPRRLFWNVLKSQTYATVNNIDDLGFVERLLSDLQSKIRVDTSRIYAAGMSQGGMLCYRLACDEKMSGRIAAIAPVGAVMTVDPQECRASRAVPVISFNGLQDPIILYQGGVSTKIPRNDRINRPSVNDSIMYWVKLAGLSEKPDASGSRGQAEMKQYGQNQAGSEVLLWSLADGGHTWPGGNEMLPEWLVGNVNRDIDASSLIWDFFSRHRLPSGESVAKP